MEILLVVAIVVVAASGLFVAGTFNMRTERHTKPLIDAVERLTGAIDASEGRLTSEIDSAGIGLGSRLESISSQLAGIQNYVQAERAEMRSVIGRLAVEVADLKSLGRQLSAQLSAQLSVNNSCALTATCSSWAINSGKPGSCLTG
jgi:hypothetical protein